MAAAKPAASYSTSYVCIADATFVAPADVCRRGSKSASSPTPVPTSGQPDRSISLLNQPPTSRVQAGLAIEDIAPALDDVDDSIHQDDTSVNAARQPTEAFEEAALNALRTRKTCKRPASALDAKVMKAMPKGKAKAKPKCSAERKTTPPSLSMEWSRKQVMCRTGEPGTKCVAFPFDKHGGAESARKKAQPWVARERKARL